jgi:hypothetical protein
MRHFLPSITFFTLVTIVGSCKKDKNITGCFPNATTVRQISNMQAVIKLTATVNPVWIIEQGLIDNILIPCNFPMEFYQDGLQVIISGEVKSTLQSGSCCTENFVITKISR